MVNLNIDGRLITVPEGSTLLEAALTNGIDVPTSAIIPDSNQWGTVVSA